jgi:hypothetical protein
MPVLSFVVAGRVCAIFAHRNVDMGVTWMVVGGRGGVAVIKRVLTQLHPPTGVDGC